MTSLLIIEADGRARQSIAAALDGLGYSLTWLDGLKAWRDGQGLAEAEVDLVLLSLDCLDGCGAEDISAIYGRGPRPVPVVVWSRDLPRSRMVQWVPPEVLLAAVFEGVPSPAEILLFVSGRFPPSQRGLAVQRLLKLLASPREPLRTATPRGTHEVADFGLPRALVSLSAEGWSGSVTVEPLRGASQCFWFEDGALVLATDRRTGELLREARRRGLDRRGAAPQKPFEDLREELLFLRRTAGLSTGDRGRLVEWYCEGLLAKACAVTAGRIHVVDFAQPAFRVAPPSGLDIRSLLLAAARLSPQDVLEGQWMQDAWFVLPSMPVGDEADSWSLDGPELALHDYLKASRATRISVGKVKGDLVASGATGEQLAALLARLSEMGYLRFVGAPFDEVTMSELTTLSASALLGGGENYFSFLGVPQRASKKVVDAAVLEASRKWHPDALVGRHPRVQALGSKLFTLLREAADIVGDMDSRQAYIEDLADGQLGRGGQDRERARVLLAKGRISLKGKHYTEAAREFEAAAASDPTLFIARILAQWAGFLGNPDGAETSIAALQSLGREAGAPPELWHFLGRMYLYLHNKDRARRCFEKVLKLDPENRDSQRQLRLLVKRSGGEQSPSNKGFWSRLRGR